ncbi:hypothetical protein C10C_0108 [Chlamydia serpentis]|uniref:Uncharacterized protein n=1 Tax=Chlamydia serpentis TaxID=1967782 RepID=A0A2R8FA51_9CHLA|nr:hypothetical protein [Chlamydia serpentis]SPN73293.1 hypothetical protein C10C_0108 [Chlamydia serpentis]
MGDAKVERPTYNGSSLILKTSVAQEVFKQHRKAFYLLLIASIIVLVAIGISFCIFPEYVIAFVLTIVFFVLGISIALFFLMRGLRFSLNDRLWLSEKGYALSQNELGPFLDVRLVREILEKSPYIKSRALLPLADISEDPGQAAVVLLSPWTFFSSMDSSALFPIPQQEGDEYTDHTFPLLSRLERTSLLVLLSVFTLNDIRKDSIPLDEQNFFPFVSKKAKDYGVQDLKYKVISWLKEISLELEPDINFQVSRALFSAYRYLRRPDLTSLELERLHLISCFQGNLVHYLSLFVNPKDLSDPEFLNICKHVEWDKFIAACKAAFLKNPKGIYIEHVKQFLLSNI